MSFTDNYMRMCGGAKEIRDGWTSQLGDYYINLDSEVSLITSRGGSYPGYHRVPPIWLPRQDQLQRMVQRFVSPARLLDLFAGYIEEQGEEIYDAGYSLEELWLMYLMSKTHNKTWNGEDWI